MNDFLILYAPIIVLFASTIIAFWAAFDDKAFGEEDE